MSRIEFGPSGVPAGVVGGKLNAIGVSGSFGEQIPGRARVPRIPGQPNGEWMDIPLSGCMPASFADAYPNDISLGIGGVCQLDDTIGYAVPKTDLQKGLQEMMGWQDKVVEINKNGYDVLGDGISNLQLVQIFGTDRMVVNAARVSYANDVDLHAPVTEKDRKLIRFLLKHHHGTPLEHNLITFRVKAPLYVVQEMLRHRIGTSFNQQSHRYIEPGKGEENVERKFYVPTHFRYQHKTNRQASEGEFPEVDYLRARADYLEACEFSYDQYQKLIDAGVAREQARGVLPHSTYTSLYFTLNLRSLMHFLGLRLEEDAQWEIRQYANQMNWIAEHYFPVTLGVWRELRDATAES